VLVGEADGREKRASRSIIEKGRRERRRARGTDVDEALVIRRRDLDHRERCFISTLQLTWAVSGCRKAYLAPIRHSNQV
jgi:hypothetical protein